MLFNEKETSKTYCDVLRYGLSEFSEGSVGDTYIFQQDKTSMHRSGHTIDWLDANRVYTMEWPAKSPDLNPMENILGILHSQFTRINVNLLTWKNRRSA